LGVVRVASVTHFPASVLALTHFAAAVASSDFFLAALLALASSSLHF